MQEDFIEIIHISRTKDRYQCSFIYIHSSFGKKNRVLTEMLAVYGIIDLPILRNKSKNLQMIDNIKTESYIMLIIIWRDSARSPYLQALVSILASVP